MSTTCTINDRCSTILCQLCGYVSKDPVDVVNLYCPFCATYHESEKAQLLEDWQGERRSIAYWRGVVVGAVSPWILLCLIALVVALLGGCVTTTWTTHKASATTIVPDTPERAYAKALRAAVAMGGILTALDPAKRTVSARLNKAVMVQTLLTPDGNGTRLDVYATAEAGYFLGHDVGEDAQAFLAAYQKEQG